MTKLKKFTRERFDFLVQHIQGVDRRPVQSYKSTSKAGRDVDDDDDNDVDGDDDNAQAAGQGQVQEIADGPQHVPLRGTPKKRRRPATSSAPAPASNEELIKEYRSCHNEIMAAIKPPSGHHEHLTTYCNYMAQLSQSWSAANWLEFKMAMDAKSNEIIRKELETDKSLPNLSLDHLMASTPFNTAPPQQPEQPEPCTSYQPHQSQQQPTSQGDQLYFPYKHLQMYDGQSSAPMNEGYLADLHTPS